MRHNTRAIILIHHALYKNNKITRHSIFPNEVIALIFVYIRLLMRENIILQSEDLPK